MPCPFYGHYAAELIRTLIPSHGNQCALITRAHAPCAMEMDGKAPDLDHCDWNLSARAIEFAKFQRATQTSTELKYRD
jgi:hypothetical protein